jgi:hypothetical protein
MPGAGIVLVPGNHRRRMMKYPNVKVKLVGEDGNAFAILGRVRRELRRVGVPKEECDRFMAEATAGDYNHLLDVCMKWVDVR